MLHQRITEKGVMHTVACLLAEDLRQELDIYTGYTVRKEEYDDSAWVQVYSNKPCDIITSAAIGDVMDVLKHYCMQYFDISYHFGTITLVSGDGERVLPCIKITISVARK